MPARALFPPRPSAQAVANSMRSLNQMDREQRYQRSLTPPVLGYGTATGGYRTTQSPPSPLGTTSIRRSWREPFAAGQQALAGRDFRRMETEEDPGLFVGYPHVLSTNSLAPQPQVVNQMTPYAGQHLGLSMRGVPITEEGYGAPEAAPDTALGRAQRRVRHGGQFMAYRGLGHLPDVSEAELQRRREAAPSNVRTRRENAPLPGFPRLPARMTDEQREASMAQRRAARGLRPMVEGEGSGTGGGVFMEGYQPPVDPSTGQVDRGQVISDAIGRLDGFTGSREEFEAELQGHGVTWDQFIEQSMSEIYPDPWEFWDFGVGPMVSGEKRLEMERRFRQYEKLRELDPSLPAGRPWGLGIFHEPGGGQTQDDKNRRVNLRPPRELTPQERARRTGPFSPSGIFGGS